jgi:phosphoglycolate phosphatase
MDILVDLDGTLVDPAAGIVSSFQAGLKAVGAPAIAAADLGWIIGPPLRQSYPQAGVALKDVEAALAAYRETYRAGAMFDVTPYPGIEAALTTLHDQGHRLIVATSKPHVFARPILERFGLARHFAAIHGSELDGRNDDKGDLIGHIIATERVNPASTLMIGDRKFDCLGAAQHGIRTIGALWGYGGEAELTAAGAVALAHQARDLPAVVARLQ